MIIDQLPNIQLPVLGTDEMPVERGQYTYKAAFEDISTTIKNGLDVIRPNLLDNWYFMSGDYYGLPINSRNKSTYNIPPAARTYTLDRWFVFDRGGDGTFEIYSNGIKLNRSGSTVEFGQFLEPALIGETVTISVLVENTRRLISGTGVVANNAVLIDDPYLTASFTRESTAVNTMTVLHLTFKSSSSLVIAAKLEIGDSQTLAHQENGTWILNELPNYEEQLTRCMVSRADPSDAYANKVISFNAPNPNLLDNWYFVGGGSQQGGGQFPINQRGQTSYSGAVYGIDRWKATNSNANVSVTSGYLRFYGTNGANVWLQNWSDNKAIYGKQITISMLLDNGTLLTKSGSITTAAVSSNTGFDTTAVNGISFGVFKNSGGNWFVQIANVQNGGSVVNADIVAVKLELGTTQTLAHQENGVWVLNEIPNYQQEFAKCMRYLCPVLAGAIRYDSGQLTSSFIDFAIPVPTVMAKSCTIVDLGSGFTIYSVDSSTGQMSAQTGFTVAINASPTVVPSVLLRATKTSHGLTKGIIGAAGSSAILISAEP